MKKLFLLDGMALIYRAHFALSKNPRFTSSGMNTSAVMGFANTLMEVLRKEKPTHMAVVFDTDAPTERHTDFADYKAHRESMPEDLSRALPYVVKLIQGFNIPVITSDVKVRNLIQCLSETAICYMVIYHTCSLHMRIANSGSKEFESAFFHVLCNGI